MGIKNLKVILNQKCKNAINVRKLDSYRGMILGIDTSIFLYKYLYNNNDHIEGLTRLILRFLKNQITPIFVFDGKPPKEKDGTLLIRKERKDYMYIKKNLIENCIKIDKTNYDDFKKNIIEYIDNTSATYKIDDDEIKDLFEKSNDELEKECEKITKKIIHVTQYHIESSKKLFDLFGVKYIHAPCEAESLISMLSKNNIVDGCVSEDTDILANGGYLFLRNFNADKNNVDEYCLQGILDSLNITYDQFIDMCILCGCDYTEKINGLGPMTSYKLINKYNNIETILQNNDKFIIPNNFDYITARYLFKNPIEPEMYDKIDKNTRLTEPKFDELKSFLQNTKLKDKYLKEIDKNLMNYFLNIDVLFNLEKKSKITDYFH
jgi:flap endonuclease-1